MAIPGPAGTTEAKPANGPYPPCHSHEAIPRVPSAIALALSAESAAHMITLQYSSPKVPPAKKCAIDIQQFGLLRETARRSSESAEPSHGAAPRVTRRARD